VAQDSSAEIQHFVVDVMDPLIAKVKTMGVACALPMLVTARHLRGRRPPTSPVSKAAASISAHELNGIRAELWLSLVFEHNPWLAVCPALLFESKTARCLIMAWYRRGQNHELKTGYVFCAPMVAQ
jgi:hypothetical protein